MNKALAYLKKEALNMAAAAAKADVAVNCAGPFGQPKVPSCLKK